MALGVGLTDASATGQGLCHETCMCANHSRAGIHTAPWKAKTSQIIKAERKKESRSCSLVPAAATVFLCFLAVARIRKLQTQQGATERYMTFTEGRGGV